MASSSSASAASTDATPSSANACTTDSASLNDHHVHCTHCRARIVSRRDWLVTRPDYDEHGQRVGYIHQTCRKHREHGAAPRQHRPRIVSSPATAAPTAAAASTTSAPAAAAAAATDVVTLHHRDGTSEHIHLAPPHDTLLKWMFAHYGYVRVPASDRTRAFVNQLLQATMKLHGEPIAGNVHQYPLDTSPAYVEQLQQEWESIVRGVASSLGIAADQLFVVDPKLLVGAQATSNHSGFDQPVHWDCARGVAAASKYSILLVCMPGTKGTALPLIPFATDYPDFLFSNASHTMREYADFLNPKYYYSSDANVGDIIFFRQSIPHFGVANTSTLCKRILLFSILSPSNRTMQDAKQVMPWLYIGTAFEWSSEEFARALVDNKQHKPLQLIKRDFSAQDYNVAVNCLQKHKLYSSYFS
jgi:hypothetical protein